MTKYSFIESDIDFYWNLQYTFNNMDQRIPELPMLFLDIVFLFIGIIDFLLDSIGLHWAAVDRLIFWTFDVSVKSKHGIW